MDAQPGLGHELAHGDRAAQARGRAAGNEPTIAPSYGGGHRSLRRARSRREHARRPGGLPMATRSGPLACTAVPIYAELSSSAIVVSPGGEEIERLTIRNLGSATESYAVVPLGMCAGWTLIDPPHPHPLPGRGADPEGHAAAAAVAVGGGRRLGPRPAHRAPRPARRRRHRGGRAHGAVVRPAAPERPAAGPALATTRHLRRVLENQGNAQASCRLVLSEPGRPSRRARFDPPSIGCRPGAERGLAGARQRQGLAPHRITRRSPFTIEPCRTGSPTRPRPPPPLLQPTVLSRRTVGGLAWAVAAVLGLGAAWNWVARAGDRRRGGRGRARAHPADDRTGGHRAPGHRRHRLDRHAQHGATRHRRGRRGFTDQPAPVDHQSGRQRGHRGTVRARRTSGSRSPTSSCRTPTRTAVC